MNSKTLVAIAGAVALVGGFGMVSANVQAQNGPGRVIGAPGQGRVQGQHRPRTERHPELVAALRKLTRADQDLHKASRDFAGHRAKAEEFTERAIAEVKAAIASDRH